MQQQAFASPVSSDHSDSSDYSDSSDTDCQSSPRAVAISDMPVDFVFDPNVICPICMERPARVPFIPHKSRSHPEQVCKPPALCRSCARTDNCVRCIYCRIKSPPRDVTTHLQPLLHAVLNTYDILYRQIYPIMPESPFDQWQARIDGGRCLKYEVGSAGHISDDYPCGDGTIIDILWFMIFYGDYGDQVYKYELTTSKGKPLPTWQLPPDSRFNKLKYPTQKTRSFIDLDSYVLKNIYEQTLNIENIDKEPKFVILCLLIKIFDTYIEQQELEDHFTHQTSVYLDDSDEKTQIRKPTLIFRDIEFEIFQNLDKFKAATINPRFYTDAQSLGMPRNLNRI